MADIAWSSRAGDDLASIADYIAQDSPQAARAWVSRITQSVERLKDFPHSGRVVPEYEDAEVRELIVANYRIIYRVMPSGVEIVRVWHGARPLPPDNIP